MILLSSFLFTTGIIATLLILVILQRAPDKELPQKLLLIVFILLFFVCFNAYAELHEITLIERVSFLFADTIGFALGPLLFVYIHSLYLEDEHVLKRYKYHFIPLLIYLLCVSIPIWLSEWGFLPGWQALFEPYEYLLQLQGLYLIIYCLISLRTIRKYQTLLKQNYANLQEKDLEWIRFLLIGIILTLLINLVLVFIEFTLGAFSWDSSIITTFVLIGLILYLGYYGSSQARILIPAHLIQPETILNKNTTDKPVHHLSNASEEEIHELTLRLEQVLKKEKAYLEEELSLGSLAERMETTEKKLSALLNHYIHTSFYDLINQYRVMEVKEKMAAPEFSHYTLLALAYDSGFKSKTSFNRVFKKNTGYSPSAYKKHIQERKHE